MIIKIHVELLYLPKTSKNCSVVNGKFIVLESISPSIKINPLEEEPRLFGTALSPDKKYLLMEDATSFYPIRTYRLARKWMETQGVNLLNVDVFLWNGAIRAGFGPSSPRTNAVRSDLMSLVEERVYMGVIPCHQLCETQELPQFSKVIRCLAARGCAGSRELQESFLNALKGELR